MSAIISYQDSDVRTTFAENDSVVGTGILTPCCRNTWTLVPEDESRHGKEIRFGDIFYIKLATSDLPLYVYALSDNPGLQKGKCNHPTLRLSSEINPLMR